MMVRHAAAVALAAAALAAGCRTKPEAAAIGVDLSAQALAAAEASGLRPAAVGGGTLRIYTWCDYIAPDVIAGFEKALGVKVVVDTFESNESMFDSLKAGGAEYDLITPSSYQIEAMVDAGLVEAVDHAKLPNVRRNFDPSFAEQILDPSFMYSVPYAVTYTGFVYVKDKIPAGADVNSWAILGHPALKGRVTLLDDIREVIGGGLMYLGYSVNSANQADIDAAVGQILKWRENVSKFDGESYKTEVPDGEAWLGLGYSSDAAQIILGRTRPGAPVRDDIGFALPREGFSLSFDEFVIASGSKSKDLAYAFVNYIYNGEVAKVNMEHICCVNPVRPGIEMLNPAFRKAIVLDASMQKDGQVIRDFDGRAEVIELYDKAWERIKSAEAR